MRTLTPLILLPLVVLAPLLIAPTAYAIDVESRPTLAVVVEGKLGNVADPTKAILVQGISLGYAADPDGLTGIIDLIFLQGKNNQTLQPFGEPLRINATGYLQENIVVISGLVDSSTDPDLSGTPFALTANATSSEIVFVFGPIPSGRLAGQTFTFTGVGTVIIVCLDCRSD